MLLPYIAVEATGSDAVNAESDARFTGISQINGPILKLRLRISQVAKLVSFAAAMYRKLPTR